MPDKRTILNGNGVGDYVAIGNSFLYTPSLSTPIYKIEESDVEEEYKRFDEAINKSIKEISGGELQRVFLAMIFSQEPNIIVLDEPTAGLDPQGAKEMMTLFMRLNREQNKTVLLVTHDMEHVMKYCDHVIVLDHGAVKQTSDVKTFFEHPEWIVNIGINPPSIIRLKMRLKEAGFDIPDEIIDEDGLLKCIKRQVKIHE